MAIKIDMTEQKKLGTTLWAIAGIQQGLKEALSGQLIPLAQMWEGIERN